MQMNRFLRFCLAAGLAFLCVFSVSAGKAEAAGTQASLTINCAVGGTVVSGVRCRLYRTADLDGTTFTLSGGFENSKVKVNGVTAADAWQTAANSLAVYAAAADNKITAVAEKTTDTAGKAAFTGLDTGLYLAVFDTKNDGSSIWTFAAELISLPQWTSDQKVLYDVTAAPKGTVTSIPVTPTPKTVDVTVLKVWEDTSAEKRPAAITAKLCKDGVTYATVELNDANNWRYTWTGLESGPVWSVLEDKVPDGYTTAYTTSATASGSILTITNTATTDIPGGKTPTGSKTPGTTPKTPTGSKTKLPQTGLLWWPVPILTICGLLIASAGFLIGRSGSRKKKQRF